MKFHGVNHHKSDSIERFASDLQAIESIIGFRRRHRTVFNVIMTFMIFSIVALAVFYVIMVLPPFALESCVVGGVVFVGLMLLIWKRSRRKKRRWKTNQNAIRPHYRRTVRRKTTNGGNSSHDNERDSKTRSGHAVVRSHNKFLLLRKSYGNPNRWHCPGGMAKHTEHRIDAAVRETYEETGCKVIPVKQLRKSDTANYYLCNKVGGHATRKSHEILEIKWFSLEEVKELHQKKLLANCNIAWFERIENENGEPSQREGI